MRASALAVMAKAPLAGQVKTRLMPGLTAQDAAALSSALLLDQLNHVQELGMADFYLAYAPDSARLLMERLAPSGFHLFAQQGADLGARMQSVFARLFAAGHKQIVLIGGDLAPVPRNFFEQAYDFLQARGQRVVLGPSRDGGYYLVGCNRLTPQMFQAMTWSHSEVLAQTRVKLASLKIDYRLLPTWFDIDTLADMRYLQAVFSSTLENTMPNTLRLLRRLGHNIPGCVD
jgi:uncharacterized protein